jgi:hypothetical protein
MLKYKHIIAKLITPRILQIKVSDMNEMCFYGMYHFFLSNKMLLGQLMMKFLTAML